MDKKKIIEEFDIVKEKGKTRRNITIDWDLDLKLRQMPEIKVSTIINQFLWYYIMRSEGSDKDWFVTITKQY